MLGLPSPPRVRRPGNNLAPSAYPLLVFATVLLLAHALPTPVNAAGAAALDARGAPSPRADSQAHDLVPAALFEKTMHRVLHLCTEPG